MGETERTEKAQKKNWFKGLKTEFGKIVWPKKNTVAKETATVAAIVLGIAVAVFDFFVQYGMDLLIK